MFTAKDFQHYQHHYLWNSPCSNSTNAFLEPGHLPSGFLDSKTGQLGGTQGPSQWLPPHVESSSAVASPHFKAPHCALACAHGVKATPDDVSASAHKRFLIFDQSGGQIRWFSNPFRLSYQDWVIMPKTPVGSRNLPGEKLEAEQLQLMKATQSDEYCIKSEEGDTHEDTEELNALLYSDSFSGDDDDSDHHGEDDELISTGHSPFAITGGNVAHEKVWELTEEVGTSDVSTKRYKLLDGGYKKSSLVDTAGSLKMDSFCNYDDAVESSCAKGKDLDKDMDSNLATRQKQAKIRETLRILESMIPGMESKDPLLIIDEAINYLKSLREMAEALEVGSLKCNTTPFHHNIYI